MARKPGRNLGALMDRWDDLQVVWKLMQDDRVDGALKLIPILTALYVILPIDLIPDMFFGVGQMDDVGLVLVALAAFLKLAPSDRVAQARRALGQNVEEVDVQVRRGDEEP